jgi:hypothetical protein
MKKLILAAITTACAASVFAQGTINFTTRTGSGSSFVWVGGATQYQGTNYDYAALGLHVVGAAGNTAEASHFWTQLIGAPGTVAESSLLPMNGVTTFRTGTAAGNVFPTTATFLNIPPDAPTATIEMVAWDNSTGNYPTWAQASAAWKSGAIMGGVSGPITVANMGGTVNTPPILFLGTGNPGNLQSFNVFFIPEPTTLTLAGLGAAALLIFRRRK